MQLQVFEGGRINLEQQLVEALCRVDFPALDKLEEKLKPRGSLSLAWSNDQPLCEPQAPHQSNVTSD